MNTSVSIVINRPPAGHAGLIDDGFLERKDARAPRRKD